MTFRAATTTDIDPEVANYIHTRHEGATPAPLSPQAAAALRALEASQPNPTDRLKQLATARTRLVADQLTTTHDIAPTRIGHIPWDETTPFPETVPGIDLQLRSK